METVFDKVKKKRVKRLHGRNSPLYKVIWPMVYVMRVFGLAPYNFSQNRLIPSNIDLIFTTIAAILYSYILYVVLNKFIYEKREGWTFGSVDRTKDIVQVVINYSVVMYELSLAAFTRGSFIRIWNALQDYDEDVKQLGHPRKETWTAIVAWILIIVTTIIWITINRSGMYAFLERWSYNMGFMLPYIGMSVAIYKFVAVAIFLGQRFRQLNMIAIKNLPSTESKGTIINKKTILSLHNDLMIIAENLESLYSLSLLFWLGHLTIHIISNIYFIIESLILKQNTVTSWPLVLCASCWLLAFLFQLLLLHIACDFACFQANCMSSILIEWQVRLMKKNEVSRRSRYCLAYFIFSLSSIYIKSNQTKECVELSLQFLNRWLKFSAGGFFYVNLPLLRSIISMMTTYLVILLQIK